MVATGVLVGAAAFVTRGALADGFHLDPMVVEPLLYPVVLGAALLALQRAGCPEAAHGLLVPLLVLAGLGLAGVLGPVTAPALDLRRAHWGAPLFFLTEAVSVPLLFAASYLALATLLGRLATDAGVSGLLVAGFLVYSLSQLVGAWWAWAGWSAPFLWSTRHLMTASLWCFYAAALHARFLDVSRRAQLALVAGGVLPLLVIAVWAVQDAQATLGSRP